MTEWARFCVNLAPFNLFGKGYSSDNSGDGPFSWVKFITFLSIVMFFDAMEWILRRVGLYGDEFGAYRRGSTVFEFEFVWEYTFFMGLRLKMVLQLRKVLSVLMRLFLVALAWRWYNHYMKKKTLLGKGYSSDYAGDGPEEQAKAAPAPSVKKEETTSQTGGTVKPPKTEGKVSYAEATAKQTGGTVKPAGVAANPQPVVQAKKQPDNTGKQSGGSVKPGNVMPKDDGAKVVRGTTERGASTLKKEHSGSGVDKGLAQLKGAYQHQGPQDDRVSKSHHMQRKVNIPQEKTEMTGAQRRLVEQRNAKRQSAIDVYKDAKLDEGELTLVRTNESPYGWSGQEVVLFENSLGGIRAVGQTTGVMYPHTLEGTIVNSIGESGVGYCRILQEGAVKFNPPKRFKAIAAVSRMEISVEFKLDGLIYQMAQYLVFTPLLEWFRKHVSAAATSESVQNVMMASSNRHFPGLDAELVSQTINFYNHDMLYKKYLKINGVGVVAVTVEDRNEHDYLRNRMEMPYIGDVSVNNSVNCVVPDTYKIRDDIVVTVYDHATQTSTEYDDTTVDGNGNQRYPVFRNPTTDGRNSYYRSNYFHLQGTQGKHFQTYAVNDLNAQKALKRIIASRGDDDTFLTQMQYSLMCSVWVEQDEFVSLEDKNRFTDVARLSFNYDDRSYFKGVRVGTFEYNGLSTPYYTNIVTNKATVPWFSFSTKNYTITREMKYGGRDFFGNLNMHEIQETQKALFSDMKSRVRMAKLDEYYIAHPSWSYGKTLENLSTWLDRYTSRHECGIIPHIKKALRLMFVEREVVHSLDDCMVRKIEAKVKKEFAKPGKVPRLFTSYGGGCMYANELPEYLKVCLDGYYHIPGPIEFTILLFAKPSSSGLKELFDRAINVTQRRNEVFIAIYSDDSLWAGNVNGVSFAYNVDISSCDSGNKGGIFALLFLLVSRFDVSMALGLIKQCSLPIQYKSTGTQDWLSVKVGSLFEGSGTVLTTLLNHTAMMMVAGAAKSIFNQVNIRHLKDVEESISKAGVCAGHVLTVESCMDSAGMVIPEKLQFLKRSPLQTEDGEYLPVLNYGTIFRSFGSVEGDMMGVHLGLSPRDFANTSMKDRCDRFFSQVVAGLVHEPKSDVMDALRERFNYPGDTGGVLPSSTRFDNQIEQEDCGFGAKGGISAASIARRYDCSECDVLDFCETIRGIRVSHVYACKFLDEVYRVDYGL